MQAQLALALCSNVMKTDYSIIAISEAPHQVSIHTASQLSGMRPARALDV